MNDALEKLKQEKEESDKKEAKNHLQRSMDDEEFELISGESIPLDLVGHYIQIDPRQENEEDQNDRRQLPILKRARFNRARDN